MVCSRLWSLLVLVITLFGNQNRVSGFLAMMESLIQKLKFGQSKVKTRMQNSNVSKPKISRLFFQMLKQLVKQLTK